MNWLLSVARGFKHAWRGLRLAFRTERSFRIQMAAGGIIILLVIILPMRDWERILLLLATGSVLVLELLNSTVERLVDLVKPRLHGYVHDIKDLMAAAVLLASGIAALIGFLILWPYIGMLLERV